MESLMIVKVLNGHSGQVYMQVAGLPLGKVMVCHRAEQREKQGRKECEGCYGKKKLGTQQGPTACGGEECG